MKFHPRGLLQADAVMPTRGPDGLLTLWLRDLKGRVFARAVLLPEYQEAFVEDCRRIVAGEATLNEERDGRSKI